MRKTRDAVFCVNRVKTRKMRRIYSVGNQSALFTKLPGPAGAGARSQAVARDPQSAAGRTSESQPPWTHARPVQSRSEAGPSRPRPGRDVHRSPTPAASPRPDPFHHGQERQPPCPWM